METHVQATKLCQTCSCLFTGHWSEAEYNSEASTSYEQPGWLHRTAGNPAPYQHHSIIGLSVSASNGCQLCSRAWDQASDIVPSLPQSSIEHAVGFAVVLPDDESLSLQVSYFIDGKYDELLNLADHPQRLEDLEDERSNLSTSFSTIPSAMLVQKIRQWATECQQEHSDCLVADIGSRPKRLLYLGRGSIHLHSDVQPHVTYTTLSHCWGGNLSVRLVGSNIEQFHDNIPIDALPRTFQDAVHFTRALGIDFLWIDALCIIQDSKEDWLEGSTRIAEIYSNAFLNIAATSSNDGQGGLYKSKSQALLQPCLVTATWIGHPPGTYLCLDSSAWHRRVDAAPLNERAWVFQERLLAPRTVHFAGDQLWCSCQETKVCESLPSFLDLGSPGNLLNFGNTDDTAANEDWVNLVTTYSSAELTKHTDRLVALAGVASTVCKNRNWSPRDFFAGLWKHDILVDLLWRMLDEGKRPNVPIAPSWSWASVEGGIYFHSTNNRDEYRRNLVVELINIHAEQQSFAAISCATITIRAPLHKIALSSSKLSQFFELQVDGKAFSEDDFAESMDDSRSYDQPYEGFWCRCATRNDETWVSEGLILTATVKSSEFRREGWLRVFHIEDLNTSAQTLILK